MEMNERMEGASTKWRTMKYLILILLIASLDAYCQKSFFGVDAGINLSNQRTSASSNGQINQIAFAQTVPRLTFGVFYQRSISKVLSIRVGAKYNGLGFRRDDQTFYRPIPGFSSTDIDYITLPINFVYHANPNFRIMAGGYFSNMIGGKNFYYKIPDLFTNEDYGINFGIEHNLFKGLSIATTYYFGLKNVLKIDSANGYDLFITNRNLQIALIYKLPFGRSAID
jgi:Outer membrane protein beta-barrel domain